MLFLQSLKLFPTPEYDAGTVLLSDANMTAPPGLCLFPKAGRQSETLFVVANLQYVIEAGVSSFSFKNNVFPKL